MATQKEIEATYDYIDEIFRACLGDHADITCAMYNGDFSLTLEQAQKAKHEYILSGINFKKGDRVLDIGCGWGPMLNAIKDHGGRGSGVTLSPAQAASCKREGFEVFLRDWKVLNATEIGTVDCVVSVGAFEHFCSIDELKAGKQDKIYDNFFKLCYDILPKGGRLYLQTMMFGKRVPKPEELNVNAPKLSDEWVMGHVGKFYPGSWLPNGLDHIVKCASPYFKLISENNGRKDYIQTNKDWGKAGYKHWFKVALLTLKLLPKYITSRDFRYQVTSLMYSCNQLCFEREIMSHQRMVFEKK
jgi:cyclopropane-fatty-acyl-phospholipid synthase